MGGLRDLAARALLTVEPETAHNYALLGLRVGLGPRDPQAEAPELATTVAGLTFANPVGLAAGFDKNAQVPLALIRAGFGFVECGTVTPLPQTGNPRPRLFRLSEDRGVINRMGFNNAGLDVFARNLPSRRPAPVGANIGANKDSPDRVGDYVLGLTRLWGLSDYFTLNISSPNTPGLRALQTRDALEELLGRVGEARARLRCARTDPPLFLKVAPDLADDEIETIIACVVRHGLNGIIVGNTTLDRPASLQSRFAEQSGGLSGTPLKGRASQMLARFAAMSPAPLSLIAAGGIASGADAYERLRAGACLVQIYSALVFEGPGLAMRVKHDLMARLKADGFATLTEAIGTTRA